MIAVNLGRGRKGGFAMKKTIRFFVCVTTIICILASVTGFAAEDHIITNPIDTDATVTIQMKVQKEKDIAYAIRSSYGDSTENDLIQYVRQYSFLDENGMDRNPSFDPYNIKDVVAKTDTDKMFLQTVYIGDERVPVGIDGTIGWIGAGHGGNVAMKATVPNHGLSYDSIGKVYTDASTKHGYNGKAATWTLLRIVDENTLIFLSSWYPKYWGSGITTNGNPAFLTAFGKDKDGNITITCGDETLTVTAASGSKMLTPSYTMDKQEVYVVNNGVKTYVTEAATNYTGEYVCFEEEYTVKNPATVAAAIAANVGKYTENPNLAVGDDYITFKLNYKYYPDGTCIQDWETTFHADIRMHMYGGIQWVARTVNNTDFYVYIPNTKEFADKSSNVYNYAKPRLSAALPNLRIAKSTENVKFTPISTTVAYDTYKDDSYTANRRVDLAGKINGETKTLSQVFAGGFLPIDDGANDIRSKNTYASHYLYSNKKSYFHFIDEQFYENHKNEENTIIGKTIKGTAYKKYANDFGDDFSYSYYTVPFERGASRQLYIYIDIFNSNTTKTFDISALEEYEIEKLEEINLAATDGWEIDENTLSVTSGDTTNESSSLVLCATYTKGIEDRIAALPDTYAAENAAEIAKIDADIKEIGLTEDKYSNIAKFNGLKTSMTAGLTEEKLATATADNIEEIEAMIKVGAEIDKNSDAYKAYEAVKKAQPISCDISFGNGDNVYLSNKVTNPGYREDAGYTILLAFYDDTKLIDVKMIEKEGTKAEAEYVDAYAESWSLGANKVKAFVWDDVSKIGPLGGTAAKQH